MSLTIRTRMLISFAMLAVLILSMGYFRGMMIFKTSQRNLETAVGLSSIIEAGARLANHISFDLIMPPNDYISTADPAYKAEFEEALKMVDSDFKDLYVRKGMTADALAVLRDVEKRVNEIIVKKTREIFEINNPIGDAGGMELMRRIDAETHEIIGLLEDNVEKSVKARLDQLISQNERFKVHANWVFVLSTWISLFLAVLFAIWVSGRFSVPILKLRNMAGEIARGNLKARTDIKGGVELQDLGNALNVMAQNLERNIAEREQAVNQLKERVFLSEFEAEIGSILNREGTLRKILNECCNAVCGNFDAAFVRIWTHNRSENMLELQASAGMYTHTDGAHSRIPVGQYEIGLVAEERKPHLTNNVIGDPRVHNQKWAKREGMTAFAGYPLTVGDNLMGVLGLFSCHALPEEVLDSLALVSQMVAAAIERKKVEESLRKNEEKFRTLIEVAPDAIVLVNQERRIVQVNSQTEKLLGYGRDELVGKLHDLVVPARFREEHAKCMKDYFLKPGSRAMATGLELYAAHKNGTEIPVDVSLSYFETDEGTIAVSIIHDITERKKSERLLKKYNEELEKDVADRTRELEAAKAAAESANRAKSDFLANMSHELRTPLNAVIGFSELLKYEDFGPLNEKQKEYADDILQSGKHLLSLINDVLDISKVEAGKMELNMEDVDVASIIEHSVIMLKEKAFKHRINISTSVAEGIAAVKADERALKQVFFNLLSNAVKFTPDGGSVSIEVKKEPHELLFVVRDTGIGIEKKDQEKVFKEFERLNGALTGKYEGIGLGLAITKRLVELHGGKICFESEGKDKGSTFFFTLPL